LELVYLWFELCECRQDYYRIVGKFAWFLHSRDLLFHQWRDNMRKNGSLFGN
jgi:hypothetical protein